MESHISTSQIFFAAELIKRGELVVFPTETVYGLGASISNPEAISKIFAVKGRPLDNPLIVHVSSIQEALDVSESPPPSFFHLARHFWPGPLTLILQRKKTISSLLSAGHPTIALRMPQHKVALALIEAVGSPLAAPSANLSGRPSPTSAQDAAEDLEGKVALILDGGPCLIGIALPLSDQPLLSPGMKYRHYAPKAALRLLFTRDDLQGSFILSRLPRKGERHLSRQTLFAELREADRQGVSLIEIYCDPTIKADAALMNRLMRAAGIEEGVFV
jgi:tRNA threonylcarbamoyl adenosine modification protein (Sua5/YciO/YrdC/YwlC family)